MREKSFSSYNKEHQIHVVGGQLWKAPTRKEANEIIHLDEETKKLSIYLHPNDPFVLLQDALYELIANRNPVYYALLQAKQRVPSLLLLVPITLTVAFIGFITVWGDLVINWVFLGENAMTVFGIPMNESAVLYTIGTILVIYFFPVLFTGEQEGFVEALNERFSNREELRKRLVLLLNFLKDQNCVETVEIWNPDVANEEDDWVAKSLLPALLDSKLEIVLNIRIDERQFVENYFQKRYEEELVWIEEELSEQTEERQAIPYDYLETWEKSLLTVYVFASTARFSKRWSTVEGKITDGVLKDIVSLRLVKVLVEQFKERLFSEEDLGKLISLELFVSRCVNDYGVLSMVTRNTNNMAKVHPSIVEKEQEAVEENMKYMYSFLQREIEGLIEADHFNDPAVALILVYTQENESIYNENRLLAIRFFIKTIYDLEQYKILKKYWHLVIENLEDEKDMNSDVYRIIGVDLLLNLTFLFERAAMYKHANLALDYVERVFPFRGKIGKAGILERQGKYSEAVVAKLEIKDAWKNQKIHLKDKSLVDLNLDIAWAVVSGRLENYRTIGRESIEDARTLLYSSFDSIRNSDQTFRLYNVLANYEEWEGKPEGAIENYNRALQIPGAHQAGLSSLLVNKGIALRLMKELEEGVFYGKQGVDIKIAIGDADQLPIAQHNLAQTCLEYACSLEDKAAKLPYLKQAIDNAQNGLDIQDSTGSVKKRGQLFTEKFIGAYECSKIEATTIDLNAALSDVQTWLKAEKEAGRAGNYDCKVVVQELLILLDEFNGTTVEDAIAWQLP